MATNPLEALLTGPDVNTTLLTPNSRYYGAAVATVENASGETLVYLRRRFVPAPELFELLQEHAVVEGDRLDNLAARYLDDPELFWRLCDANGAMRPNELVEIIGRRLRITLPQEMLAGSTHD